MGLYIGVLDRLVYAYVSQPTDQFSMQLKNLVSQHRYLELVRVSHEDKSTFRKLSTNSVLFLGVWVVLALFVLTSSISFFGQGLIMGIGLVLARDVLVDLSRLDILQQRLFWPIARDLSEHETKIVAYMFLGAFVLLSFLAI